MNAQPAPIRLLEELSLNAWPTLQTLCLDGRQGAMCAYLQVMRNNPAALRLHSKLGFVESYGYWYRVKSPVEDRCGYS